MEEQHFPKVMGAGSTPVRGTMKTAFVEVVYDDDGPAFAGAPCGTLRRAEVIEVVAHNQPEAERRAREKISGYYQTIRSTRFLRFGPVSVMDAR